MPDAPDFFMRGLVIERIDLIKEITEIGSIHDLEVRLNLVRNSSFETGELQPWWGTGTVTTEDAKIGSRSVKLAPGQVIEQILPGEIARNTFWSYWCKSATGGQTAIFGLLSDGKWETWDDAVPDYWACKIHWATRNASLVMIRIRASTTNTEPIYVDGVIGTCYSRRVDSGERGMIVDFSLTPTAGGFTDIASPSAGKALKVLSWYYYCFDDIQTQMYFRTSLIYVAGLPSKGACGLNTVMAKGIQGAIDEKLSMWYSGAGTIRGWVCVEEV